MNAKTVAFLLGIVLPFQLLEAQVLSLEEALKRSMTGYSSIKSKELLVKAAQENTSFQKSWLLPDLTVAAQQNFGTINAQNGPLYAYSGLASASTSMPLPEQNWNAAFGSLYFANVNWNIFTFGKLKQHIHLASAEKEIAVSDLNQEIFQQNIKVSAAYLNLLASQRIRYVQERNLDRAKVFFEMTNSRAASELIPEVDASLAKAEVSNAQSAQIKAYDKELDFSKALAVLLNEDYREYQLDSFFNTSLPYFSAAQSTALHPNLEWQKNRITKSRTAEQLVRANRLPNLSAFGILQGRGSGFNWDYVQNNSSWSQSYLKGAGIQRGNYLLGFSLSWNITSLHRFNSKLREQQFVTKHLQEEWELINKELRAQSALADAKTMNAVENHAETIIQLEAAQLAFQQHKALYENGLSTLVDFTQALYALNRAEIDFEIAQNNVWQALLLQAAARGDINILLNAVKK